MPMTLQTQVKGWTQTLEASATDSGDDARKIELNYPVGQVTGVWDNSSGTGTNYWTEFGTNRKDHPNNKWRQINQFGRFIYLPRNTSLSASTNCWVTYKVPDAIEPIMGAYGASGYVSLAENWSMKAGRHTFSSEMTDRNTGSPEEVSLEPPSGGMVVKSVKTVTDGTNVDMYIYSAGGSEAYSDQYSESNQDSDQIVGNGTIEAAGQSFTGNGQDLLRVEFYLKKELSPTGNATAKLYASTGSDPNRTPTGSALATSDTFDVSTLTGTYALTELTFSTPYTLVNGTTYFIVLEYTLGDATNYVNMGTDTSSPSHADNNWASYDTSWTAASTTDGCFYVTTTGTADDPDDELILWKSTGINGIDIDERDWVIDKSLTKVYVGYVDSGTNATPASTNIELRGAPLI